MSGLLSRLGLKSAFKLQNVRADTCASAHPAGICGSGGCVAGSTDSRAAYNGGGAGLSVSQQRPVSLRIMAVQKK